MKDSIFKPMSLRDIEADAASKGCTVRVAKENELMFDLDCDADYQRFQQFFHTKLTTAYPTALFEEWASKSGNRHVVVTLCSALPMSERIALQAMGGSDMGREFAALQCLKAGSPHPILLFVPTPPAA